MSTIRISLLVLLSLASRSAAAGAQLATIDSMVSATMRARNIPGVAAAVIQNGNVIYKKAFGLSNVETDAELTTTSVFELASLTKEFTAVAIMMLVEEGKVNVDAPISTYIDDAPAAWAPITVRHLLTHTSGLFAGGVVFFEGSPLLSVTTRQAFQSVAAARTFPPGDVGVYSDGGYFLLGMIIERAAGMTYRDFMQRKIFSRLGMTRTSLTDHRSVIKGRVSTYELDRGRLVNWRRDWDYELPSFFGVWSTIDDVVTWDNALRQRTLVSQATLDQMWTPGKLNDGRDALVDGRAYGFGFRVDQIRGHRVVWHNGASGTILLHFLDEQLSIVVLTNLSNTAGRHGTILADAIAGLVSSAYTPIQKLPSTVDPSPRTTQGLRMLLDSLATGRPSSMMTAAHAAYVNSLPQPVRDGLKPLAGIGPLTFIACDDVRGKGVRITDPIAQMCYYTGATSDRTYYFTFWLTGDGKAAHMRVAAPDEY